MGFQQMAAEIKKQVPLNPGIHPLNISSITMRSTSLGEGTGFRNKNELFAHHHGATAKKIFLMSS